MVSFERIIKTFNRRSASEIIAISNEIRDDDVKQKTIYSNFPKANISFYNIKDTESEDIKKNLIFKYSKEWKINAKNKLHCFELRNESVAKRSHFYEIYKFFESSNFYRRNNNYKYLSQHVLGKDSKKRGEAQNIILQVLDFKAKIKSNETNLTEIISKEVSKQININQLRNLIKKLKTIKGNTFTELVISIFSIYGNNDQIFDKCIDSIFGEFISLEKYEQFLYDNLFNLEDEDISDEDKEANITKVKDFFNLDISIFESWYNYLYDKDVGDVVFHTFHSTKGLEFDNVLIFFESNFARNQNYFNNLFNALTNGNINEDKNVERARNLLYVALTRAKHNLGVLYLSDLGSNKDTIEKIFGKINFDL